MATFNQQNQKVQYQYNADTINFGSIETQSDFVNELRNIQTELDKAINCKAIEGEVAIDADSHLKKAILISESVSPNKKSIVEHLENAKSLLVSVSGLAGALSAAIATVGALF